jgi:hypothetical protein
MKMQFNYTTATIKGKKKNTMDGTSPYLQINFLFLYTKYMVIHTKNLSVCPYPNYCWHSPQLILAFPFPGAKIGIG